ncbi:hypothetical protein [uncultured Draconibacterium sp.]|uniref:hypothetical protein n=1 Tax=uncultured Draconibacterium sp. TaxID=1573823 RepID=UPI002AA7CA0B|nr:hypothetical protein [uncultured Draconibacterium sp.]
MKRLTLLLFVLALTGMYSIASEHPGNKEILGEWKYEVPSAPYGYNAGNLVFEEQEGALKGFVKLEGNNKIDLQDLTYEEGVLKCGLYVDYNYVSLKINVDGEEMKGVVNTPEGAMPITAKKVK